MHTRSVTDRILVAEVMTIPLKARSSFYVTDKRSSGLEVVDVDGGPPLSGDWCTV